MQIAVTFRHIEPHEGMKDYVKEKVEKLEKYLENPREVHVVLSSEKFRHIAEITVISDGMTLNSQGRDSDLYAAVDQMADKIERQVRERRGKVKRKRGTVPSVIGSQEEEGSSEAKRETASMIQQRRTLVKPMSLEEAVAQLELLQEDFFLFINSNSGQINVLSRRKDGELEWVEPSLK
jgi:putative sigma-54 modulation protein